jgi:hypothetical protein
MSFNSIPQWTNEEVYFISLIASDNQVFQKLTFMCKKKGKFIVFEKLDCHLQ